MMRTVVLMMGILFAAVTGSTAAGRVPEVDAFHKLLHPLVHDALPANDYGKIREALPGLIEAAETLRGAQLPEELRESRERYRKEAAKLLKQLRALEKGKERMNEEKFGRKFMQMHDTFEKINELVR